MKTTLVTTNQNSKLALSKAKNLMSIASKILNNNNKQIESNNWIYKLWKWADDNNQDDRYIPRNKQQILHLTEIQLLFMYHIEELPKELGNLITLENMEISYNNNLNRIPKEIGNLINLQILRILDNNINHLPSSIGKLVNLEEFEFRNSKQHVELPREIGNLKSLKILDLSSTYITELPKEIGNLNSLIELNLDRTKLESLPKEVGNLKNLIELNLDGTKIESLPKEIGNIERLDILKLNYTSLKTLPKEIGNLKNLTELIVFHHPSFVKTPMKMPKEIGELSNLIELCYSGCQISFIPKNICKLEKLEKLNLSQNQLTTLPIEIFNLSSLKKLDISDNDITTLPDEILQLNNLTELDISNNPKLRLSTSQIKWILQLDKFKCEKEKLKIFSHIGQKDTWVDEKTNLMWQVKIENKQYCWDDIDEYATELNRERYGGYSDWRIPSGGELETLFIRKRSVNEKYIKKDLVDSMQMDKTSYFWSSTSLCKEKYSEYAKYVNFSFIGGLSNFIKSNVCFIRCVRDVASSKNNNNFDEIPF